MKNLVCILFIFLNCNISFSQQYLTDEICLILVKDFSASFALTPLVNGQRGYNYNFDKTTNFTVTERYSNNAPKIIQFDFSIYYNKRDRYNRFQKEYLTGNISFYFNQGLPIAFFNTANVLFSEQFTYARRLSDHTVPSRDYGADYHFLRDKVFNTTLMIYKNFILDNLRYNESFKMVLTKLVSYPPSTNPKNSLAIKTKKEKVYAVRFYEEETKMSRLYGSLYSRIESDYKEVEKEVKYYLNTGNHDIVLKGITKKFINGQVAYVEDSRLLRPNETSDFFAFTSGGWDQTSEYTTQMLIDEDIKRMYEILYMSSNTSTQTTYLTNEKKNIQPIREDEKTNEIGFTNEQLQKASSNSGTKTSTQKQNSTIKVENNTVNQPLNSRPNVKSVIAKRINANTVEVNSNTNTSDIIIKKGSKVNIVAVGSIKLGSFVGFHGPNGTTGYEGYNKLQGFRHGALLGKIGNGDWFLIGEKLSFVANNDGNLSFMVNDGDPSNNSGSFIVEYGINKTITTAPTKPQVTTSTRTQSNEQTYIQPAIEPTKTTEVGFTNEQLQKSIKKIEYVNAKDEQLKSDLEFINKSIIMNELLLSKYEGKRKTKEYWKYFDENKKLLTEKEEIVKKHKKNKILRAKEFEEQYSSSSNLKTKPILDNSNVTPTITSNVKSTIIKSYKGIINNTTFNLKSKCEMSFGKNSDGSFQLKGELDKIKLIGKWDIKGKLIEKNIYLFKGDIILGYEGTDFPKGTSAPMTITVSIDDKVMKGNYSIQSNGKNVDSQDGVFTLH